MAARASSQSASGLLGFTTRVTMAHQNGLEGGAEASGPRWSAPEASGAQPLKKLLNLGAGAAGRLTTPLASQKGRANVSV
eukprot:349603-Pyramimonas_sp.AAC.1